MNNARTAEEYSVLLAEVTVDAEAGSIRWRNKSVGRKQGAEAGSINKAGYRRITFRGKTYLAHRAIYFAATGHLPDSIDHIDRDPSNNSLSNLRPATQSLNNHNRGIGSNNTSGTAGVYFAKADGRWKACIKLGGVRRHLGTFNEKSDAIAARHAAEASVMGELTQ